MTTPPTLPSISILPRYQLRAHRWKSTVRTHAQCCPPHESIIESIPFTWTPFSGMSVNTISPHLDVHVHATPINKCLSIRQTPTIVLFVNTLFPGMGIHGYVTPQSLRLDDEQELALLWKTDLLRTHPSILQVSVQSPTTATLIHNVKLFSMQRSSHRCNSATVSILLIPIDIVHCRTRRDSGHWTWSHQLHLLVSWFRPILAQLNQSSVIINLNRLVQSAFHPACIAAAWWEALQRWSLRCRLERSPTVVTPRRRLEWVFSPMSAPISVPTRSPPKVPLFYGSITRAINDRASTPFSVIRSSENYATRRSSSPSSPSPSPSSADDSSRAPVSEVERYHQRWSAWITQSFSGHHRSLTDSSARSIGTTQATLEWMQQLVQRLRWYKTHLTD